MNRIIEILWILPMPIFIILVILLILGFSGMKDTALMLLKVDTGLACLWVAILLGSRIMRGKHSKVWDGED